MDLTATATIKALLKQFAISPSKSLGQNFLASAEHLRQIVEAAEPGPGEWIVEIGPGLGTLTRELASGAERVIAIEKDRRLLPLLASVLADCPAVELLEADALAVNFDELFSAAPHAKVVANLPYYITTPLLERLLRSAVPWRSLVFLVQREAAWRLLAQPGQAEYGLLSVLVQAEYRVELVTRVPAGAFYPAPKVTSAVVKLTPHGPSPFAAFGKEYFWQLLRAAFSQRRKQLINVLSNPHNGFIVPKEEILAALGRLNVKENIRAEGLTAHQFLLLAEYLL